MIEYVSVTASDIETFIQKGNQYTLNPESDIKIVKVEKYKTDFSNLSILSKCSQQAYSIKQGKTVIAKNQNKYFVLEDTDIFWVRDNYLYRYSYELQKYTFSNLDGLLYDMTESGILVKVEKNEAQAVAFFNVWKALSSAKGMPKNISDYALKLKAPDKWRKCSGTLYRGLRLTEDQIEEIKNGKTIELKPRPVSSWTVSKSTAEDFILNFQNTGVILAAKSTELDIILNTSKIKYLPDYMTDEQEVIVRGNGLDQVSKKSISKIYV